MIKRNWSPAQRGSRRGISIIELLVVISTLAVIGGLTGTILHTLLKADKSTAQSLIIERTTVRLAERFRNDVHQAEKGEVVEQTSDKPQELQLNGSSQIHYRVTKHRITRLVIEEDKTTSRDDFILPDCRLSLTAGTGTESQLRSLVIERPSAMVVRSGLSQRPTRALTIQAILNPNRVMSVSATTFEADGGKSGGGIEK